MPGSRSSLWGQQWHAGADIGRCGLHGAIQHAAALWRREYPTAARRGARRADHPPRLLVDGAACCHARRQDWRLRRQHDDARASASHVAQYRVHVRARWADRPCLRRSAQEPERRVRLQRRARDLTSRGAARGATGRRCEHLVEHAVACARRLSRFGLRRGALECGHQLRVRRQALGRSMARAHSAVRACQRSRMRRAACADDLKRGRRA